jgi:23S rRNA pseudouridine1911/1915/1917 synthase
MKKIKVKSLNQKIRLDVYLTQVLKEKRSYVDKLIKNQLILVNNKLPDKNGQLIENGYLIEINTEIKKNEELEFSNKKIKIVFEDKDIIVIDKPKHLIVHPTNFQEQDTLINTLIRKIKLQDFSDPMRPGIVHRLDRDTTGLIVIAKNKKSYDSLIKQIQDRVLIRKYLALVHNNFTDDFLLIKLPIDRSKQNLLKMVVSDEPKAKPAQTEVTVLENYRAAALIECHLLTGRTHQIRVHLSYIHHPIYNDELYGNYDGYKDYGQFLHAHYLSFIHPTSQQIMEFKSQPDQTFKTLQTKLRGDQ